ncbi:Eco57I restriction-modification methylase domain-containing protein [Schaalia cardiffensis]|mgnify:CR=1 FL=1|uniref:Eco57I restriction-modification methylase domain-containing protein n=2 Tax=Schaalia cardiffensis TaxID=181487 RepID=UPI0038BDF19B
MKESFSEGKSDLFAAFIQRCTGLASKRGLSAMITMQSWMFLSSFEKLRRSLLCNQWIVSMLHLGTRAFDSIGGEVVSSTAFVIENVPPSRRGTASTRCGSFVRIVDGKSEAEKIVMLDRARHTREARDGFHGASPEDFTVIPGSPIVYWLSEKMRNAFSVNQPLGESTRLAVGLQTGDNNRFLREWWEVAIPRIAFACTSREAAARSGARWFPYNKGGEFRKWYGNQEFVVNWENDGEEVRAFGTENGGHSRSRPQNTDTYFSPSVQTEIARRRELGARANWSIETVALTSKIKCVACDCSFVRNVRNPKSQNSISTEHWICTERKKGRKTGCGTCEISDTALKGFIAQVLDIVAFDEEVFNERIDHIDVQGKDHYTFHYTDGTSSSHTWRPNLKKSSWTPARKAAWGELVRARWAQAKRLGLDNPRQAPTPPEALAKYRAVAKAEAERLRAERGER